MWDSHVNAHNPILHAQQAAGWSSFVLDTNGNGVRDAEEEPGAEADAAKGTRIHFQCRLSRPIALLLAAQQR